MKDILHKDFSANVLNMLKELKEDSEMAKKTFINKIEIPMKR
jgi:hypothetical protein